MLFRSQSGKDIATSPAVPAHETDVYAQKAQEADARVAKIVQDNLGADAAAPPTTAKP